MIKLLISLLLSATAIAATFPNVKIGTSGPINSKSVLDVNSTTKGALMPRMTSAQRGAIASPTNGLLVYDTDLKTHCQYNSTLSAWTCMVASTAAALTANRALVSDANGLAAASTVTNIELEYLSGSGVTAGGVVYGNGSAFRVSAASTAGDLLMSSGTGAPVWTTGTSANTASAVVKRDASGNFSAGTITASLTGTASGNTTYTPNQYGVVLSGSGNTMTVLAPDASTTKVLTSGGAGANPSWQTPSGGSGGGGINYVALDSSYAVTNQTDSDAETTVGNWTAYADAAGTDPVDMTGGAPTVTCARTTTGGHILNGTASFEVVKDAANRQGEGCSKLVYIPPGYRGSNAQITMPFSKYSGSFVNSTDLKIAAYDVTNSVLVPVTNNTIQFNSQSGVVQANLVIASTTAQMRIGYHFATTAATALTFDFDDVYMSPPNNIGQINQSTLVGAAYIETTAACSLARADTALGSFGTDADCPGPTVEVNNGPGTIQTTDADLPKFTVNNLPPGHYRVEISGNIQQGASATACLAINDGTTTSGQSCLNTNTTTGASGRTVGFFNYTTSGNRSFELYASSTSSSVSLDNATGQERIYFSIWRSPTSSEYVYKPDLIANSWSGYHGGDCSWSLTATADYTDITGDSSCTFTERTNSNMGTVSSFTTGGNNAPGIIFTPNRAGTYFISAKSSIAVGNGDAAGLRLTDGVTPIANPPVTYGAGAATMTPVTVEGIYRTVSSGTALSLRLQGMVSAGTQTLGANGSAIGRSVEWSIFQIDQTFPAPVIAGIGQTAILQDQKALATPGGACNAVTANNWFTRDLNNLVSSETGITLASDVFTVPSGTWHIHCTVPGTGSLSNRFAAEIYDVTNSADKASSGCVGNNWNASLGGLVTIDCLLTLNAKTQLRVQEKVQTASATTTCLGEAGGASGVITGQDHEVYTQCSVVRTK